MTVDEIILSWALGPSKFGNTYKYVPYLVVMQITDDTWIIFALSYLTSTAAFWW